jgi:hypothetical protein
MTRLRLAAFVAVAGAGLAGGCCGIGNGQLMSRFNFHRQSDCECGRLESGPVVGTLGSTVIGEGPILDQPGTYGPPTYGPPVAPPVGAVPQVGPTLTPVPNVGEPPQAIPIPANPSSRMRW